MSRLVGQYREFYIKFIPSGSAVEINLSSTERTRIGAFKTIHFHTLVTPISYYCISSINNEFVLIEENDSAATTSSIITLDSGNYTTSTFSIEVQSKLNANSAYGSTYTVSINSTTGKMIITNDNGGTWNGFKIEWYTGNNGTIDSASNRIQAEKIWGAPRTELIDTTPANPQIGGAVFLTSYTSTNPIQLWGPDELLIISPELQKMKTKYNVDVINNQINIIIRIPIATNPFTQQTHIDTVSEVVGVNNQTLPTMITIDITDESGNSLNFNGGACYLHVRVA